MREVRRKRREQRSDGLRRRLRRQQQHYRRNKKVRRAGSGEVGCHASRTRRSPQGTRKAIPKSTCLVKNVPAMSMPAPRR
jgi:hypothetical protein